MKKRTGSSRLLILAWAGFVVPPSSCFTLLPAAVHQWPRSKCWSESYGKLSASTTTEEASEVLEHETICVGGDFAGLMAKFSPSNGALIAVPEHLVPASLLEWGQEPSCLEILVSEDCDLETSGTTPLLQRQTLTILPATGCGVDNLETMKSEQSYFKDQAAWNEPSESVLTFDAILPSSRKEEKVLRLETLFSLPNAHRVRVSIDLQINQQGTDEESKVSYGYQILPSSPVLIHLEHQTNTTSTHATRADGGGLDGRTVSRLLGDWLRQSQSFAEKRNPLEGEWRPVAESSAWSALPVTLTLPGNITVSTGRPQVIEESPEDCDYDWVLEICHFMPTTSGAGESLKGSRRIVRRQFHAFDSVTDYKEESGHYVI